jgi:hypothetical protein
MKSTPHKITKCWPGAEFQRGRYGVYIIISHVGTTMGVDITHLYVKQTKIYFLLVFVIKITTLIA